jgi:hypothetical protein
MFDFDDGATLVVDAEADIDLGLERPFRALPGEENVIRGVQTVTVPTWNSSPSTNR